MKHDIIYFMLDLINSINQVMRKCIWKRSIFIFYLIVEHCLQLIVDEMDFEVENEQNDNCKLRINEGVYKVGNRFMILNDEKNKKKD